MNKNINSLKKEEQDKELLKIEIIIGVSTFVMFLLLISIISLLLIPENIKVLIMLMMTIYILIISLILLKIEQIVGYYECKNCKHKHIPSYYKVLFAMHIMRIRYLKCPKCNKKTWQKKVIK